MKNTPPLYAKMQTELQQLQEAGALRKLPTALHSGKYSFEGEKQLLNLSSNDYLGLSCDTAFQAEFLNSLDFNEFWLSSCSSRLLTGNFAEYTQIEGLLSNLYGREAALFFSSGYHANSGILPAVADGKCLILADKLVHASIIDGIRLTSADYLRFRHNDFDHLEALLSKKASAYENVIIVTESIFSMDGDIADLKRLVQIKKAYSNVLLYVDEAHAVGVRGQNGLGVAEECGVIAEIDFLVGTCGKALASYGAFVLCSKLARDYLVNKSRTLIFTTALSRIQVAWTKFVFEHLASPAFVEKRRNLQQISSALRAAVMSKGYACASQSHIIPVIVGPNEAAVNLAANMRQAGFYVLPLRPPTVPAGSARLRLSLTAALTQAEMDNLLQNLPDKAQLQ